MLNVELKKENRTLIVFTDEEDLSCFIICQSQRYIKLEWLK